ncbi:hypothetical protein Tco_1148821 [Tanacetum coccineum]
MSSITQRNFCDKKMPTTEICRHELQCEKKLQENTGYGDLLKSVGTDALSFGGSILKEVAEEAKKEPVKATKEAAMQRLQEENVHGSNQSTLAYISNKILKPALRCGEF